MGQAAAKQGDRIVATDVHIVMTPGGPVQAPHPFNGIIDGGLSANVRIMGRAAATVDSTASNTPPHVPQGGSFKSPPGNRGTVKSGSAGVKINGKCAARHGDMAATCNDPADLPVGTVQAVGTVFIG